MWGSTTLKSTWRINCVGGEVNSLSFSHLSPSIAVLGCGDNCIRLWDYCKKSDPFYWFVVVVVLLNNYF